MHLRKLFAALFLASAFAFGSEGIALAQDPRFGDSTWVAPYPVVTLEETPETSGPRVAERDRTRIGETILRAPFRAIGFPLRLLADVAGVAGALIIFPYVTPYPIYPLVDYGATTGLVGGVGLRSPPSDSTGWTGSLTATASTKHHRHVGLEQRIGRRKTPLMRIQSEYKFRPNLPFYGLGNSSDDGRFIYLEEEALIDAFFLIGSDPMRRARLIGGYSHISARRGSDSDPSIEEGFGPSEVPFFLEKSGVVSYGVGADLAFLNRASFPSKGVHGRVEARRVHGVEDTDLEYIEWHLEGRGYVPVFADRRAIAVRVIQEGVDPASGSRPVPYYRLRASGGDTQFSAFPNERFRDEQLLLAHVEYRWEIWDFAWAYGFTQWGAVASSVDRFRYADGHESHGGGFRFGFGSFIAALEVAQGSEGLRVRFSTGDF